MMGADIGKKRRVHHMKAMTLAGAVLILLGVGGLIYGHVSYTTDKTILDIGSIHATAETTHTIPIPDIASVAALLVGLVLVVVSTKRA
jgi:hypothetical protein